MNNCLSNASSQTRVNFWDLPDGVCVEVKNLPLELMRGPTITIGKLKRIFGRNTEINKYIIAIVIRLNKKYKIPLNLPINLDNKYYAQLYSLMRSEGSKRTEFSLHVTEKEFHDLFRDCLIHLIGNIPINSKFSRNILRSRAPRIIRYLVPIPESVPQFILANKELSREYLRVAFEAEANFRYKILANGAVNRRIKLSRNSNIDNLTAKLDYSEGDRIPFGQFKLDYPDIALNVLGNYPPTIFGEKQMLDNNFGIKCSLRPESIRVNKTSKRAGKIVAKWTLTIHSININRFIEQIGAITERKKQICAKMLNVTLRRPNYYAFDIIKEVSKDNVFDSNDFSDAMIKLGYKYPRVFLSKYIRKNLIKKVGLRKYELV